MLTPPVFIGFTSYYSLYPMYINLCEEFFG
jgi:hypothetical protein